MAYGKNADGEWVTAKKVIGIDEPALPAPKQVSAPKQRYTEADCKVGDKVVLWMTGDPKEYVAECIATKEEPGDLRADLQYDLPRFKLTGKMDADGNVTPDSLPGNMVLKPGDYVLLRKM